MFIYYTVDRVSKRVNFFSFKLLQEYENLNVEFI